MAVAALVELELVVLDQIGGKLADVDHLGRGSVVEHGSGDRRFRNLEEVGRSVHGVHILMQHPPHMAALAAEDELDAEALGLGVHLGVELLHRLVVGEQAEVTALGGIGRPGVVQADMASNRIR